MRMWQQGWNLLRRPSATRAFASPSTSASRPVVVGIVSSLLLVLIGISASGDAAAFFNLPSLLIVLGGTTGATIAHYTFDDLRATRTALARLLAGEPEHPEARAAFLARLARTVRQEGAMVLESQAQRTRDPFLRKALEVTCDGQHPDEIRRMLDLELQLQMGRAERAEQVMETMAGYAPAMGLIGTLIGLIQMMGSLTQPALIGPAMAVALVTTFYGAILGNMVCQPLAGTLRRRRSEQQVLHAMVIEAMVSIARQEAPVVLDQRLTGFVPSSQLSPAAHYG